jgi:hypothetical protein
MSKLKAVLIGIFAIVVILVVLPVLSLLLGLKPRSGLFSIRNNKEIAKLIPVLREDTPLIIDRLEILRLGFLEKIGENRINIYIDKNDMQIKIFYLYHDKGGQFVERLDEISGEISDEEMEAIDTLFLSDELQLNVSSIFFVKGYNFLSYYAIFVIEGRYALGIYYFDPNDNNSWLHIFRRLGDYVEERGSNYWIVMWYME